MSFTRVMIDLGNSTNLNAQEAASSLAKFANITKMSAKDYSKLGSTVVALGNNFATTEKDIVDMATRLAATGEITGLSETQIIALATAMSSVGIEAEAGGSAMSKLLKKIQIAVETGSEKMKDFAKVAGVSGEEFKRIYGEDSVKALSLFISGLNDTERNGKSAITILEDMGLSEVRLSNAILSLTNASDLMNDAIDLANKSWKENNALSKEAEKRYGTLKSKIETSKNKIKDISVTIGNKLMPVVEKVLDKVEKWSKKLEDLNDEQIETIVKVGGMIAVLGPGIKVIGNLVSGVGQAITVFGKLSGVLGPTTLAVGGVTTAMILNSQITKMMTEEQKKLKESNEKIIETVNSQQNSYKELKSTRQEILDVNLSEMENTQKLYDELRTLVDENGNVKEGYKDRVNYILTELNKALGTEYELNGNIVKGYQKIQDEIQKTINLRKAEVIVETEKEAWKEAIKSQAEAYDSLEGLNEQYDKTLERVNKLQQEWDNYVVSNNEARKNHDYIGLLINTKNYDMNDYYELISLQNKLSELENSINNQQSLIKSYANDIVSYEADCASLLSGTEDDISNIINKTKFTYKSATDTVGDEIKKQIKLENDKLKTYKTLYDEQISFGEDAATKAYKTQVESQEKILNNLADSLVKQTKTLGVESPKIIEAWKELGENNYNIYTSKIEELPEDMKKIVKDAVSECAIGFETNSETVVTAVGGMTKEVNASLKANLNGSKWGEDLIDEMSKGLKNNNKLSMLKSAASNVAMQIKKVLGFSLPEEGPLSDFDKSMPDMIDLMVDGLEKSKNKLNKETKKIAEEINDNLNNSQMSYTNQTKQISSSNNALNEETLYKSFFRALTSCKIKLDKDGFIQFIDDRLLEVM